MDLVRQFFLEAFPNPQRIDGDPNGIKPEDAQYRGPGWTEIASAVTEEGLASQALQRLRERIALYRRRGEKQGT